MQPRRARWYLIDIMVTLDQAGHGRHTLTMFEPSAELAEWVEHAWVQEFGDLRDGDRTSWRIVPDASPHLIMHWWESDPRAPTVPRLVGARSAFCDARVARRVRTLGLRLRPGVLPLLTSLPATDLLDRSVRVDEAMGTTGRELRERTRGTTVREAYAALLSAVRDLVRSSRGIDWRIRGMSRLLERSGREVRVGGLARAMGASDRTLRNAVRAEVGLAPKRVARVHRLHRALSLRLDGGGASWHSVAIRAGYCDQAHLIKDFQQLLGEAPARFLSRRGAVPIPTMPSPPDRLS